MRLELSSDDVKPIVAEAVVEVLAHIQADQSRLPSCRLAFTESEAAALLGLKPHVLRDARLRGEIHGSLLGKRICYTRDDLMEWVRSRRVER